jgi:hypothetical protein
MKSKFSRLFKAGLMLGILVTGNMMFAPSVRAEHFVSSNAGGGLPDTNPSSGGGGGGGGSGHTREK